jgi:hypothetical protein
MRRERLLLQRHLLHVHQPKLLRLRLRLRSRLRLQVLPEERLHCSGRRQR